MRRITTYFLLLAGVTCLHYAHQVCMLSLLLRLGAAGSRVGDIHAILGHYGETRNARLGGLLEVLLRPLGDTSSPPGLRLPQHRARHGRISTRGRGGWAGREHWLGGGRQGRALAEHGKRKDVVSPNSISSHQVDGCAVEEFVGHLGQLVLGRRSARDVGIDQLLQLFGSESREELQLSPTGGLGEVERDESRYCRSFGGVPTGGGGGRERERVAKGEVGWFRVTRRRVILKSLDRRRRGLGAVSKRVSMWRDGRGSVAA